MRPSECFGSSHPYQESSYQARSIGHSYRIQVLRCNFRLDQGILNTSRDNLDMMTAGYLWHHPTKTLMALNLTSNDVG
ncbi:Uncharacterised protein [Chlamydia trachomatis]|nr:Uncharacterised protein [Chlamydia trachomatis]